MTFADRPHCGLLALRIADLSSLFLQPAASGLERALSLRPMHTVFPTSRPRGVALFATVLVFTLLAVLVVFLGRAVRVESLVARNRAVAVKQTVAADSAAQAALALIDRCHASGGNVDSLESPWALGPLNLRVGSTDLSVEITDEERRMDVNALYSPGGKSNACPGAAERLFLDVAGDARGGERLADWIDADPDGAYETGARNAPLASLGDLYDVPQLSPLLDRTYRGGDERLVDFLTIYADGNVNVNTVSEPVLAALIDNASLAARLVAQRRRSPLEKREDVKEITAQFDLVDPAWLRLLSFRSTVFRIRVRPADQPERLLLDAVVRPGGQDKPTWLMRYYPG